MKYALASLAVAGTVIAYFVGYQYGWNDAAELIHNLRQSTWRGA